MQIEQASFDEELELQGSGDSACDDVEPTRVPLSEVKVQALCKMSIVDWRWASSKGFWDKRRRCWNEKKGGMEGYLAERSKSLSKPPIVRKVRKNGVSTRIQGSNFNKWITSRKGVKTPSFNRKKYTPFIRKSHPTSDLQHSKTSSAEEFKLTAKDSVADRQDFTSHGLGLPAVRRFWTYGSDTKSFNDVPRDLLVEMKKSCDALQSSFDDNTSRILAANPSSFFAQNLDLEIFDAQDFDVSEAEMWEDDITNGVVQVEFDPSSQNRKSVVVNSRAAHLMNVRKEDLLAFFASNQVPLLMTELDALRVFLVDLHCCFADHTVHYIRRVIRSAGTDVMAMLLCRTRVHVFTKAGQISKVNQILSGVFQWESTDSTVQVKECVRVVTASEYDEALRNHPSACPLAMMGDMRSGQELLDSAKTDLEQTIAQMPMSEHGRQILSNLVILTRRMRLSSQHREHSFLDIHDVGDIRDCCSTPEAPYYHPHDDHSDTAAEPGDLSIGGNWAMFASHRFWNVGYQAKVIQNLFNAVPRRLVSAIEKVSTLLKATSHRVMQSRIDSDNWRMQWQGTPIHPATKMQDWLEEEAIWDEELARGFLRFEWEPNTNLRKHISLNHCCARSFHMGKDEALTRFANHDFPLFSTEMDLLRSFLFSLFHEFDDEVVEYTRRMVRVDGAVQASLVCIRSKQIFNQWGQVYETKHTFSVITADQYDAALEQTPWACSLAVMGDRRPGRKLLARAEADARKTVASLAATRRGRSALARMAGAIEVLSRGPDAMLHSLGPDRWCAEAKPAKAPQE